MAKTQNVVGAGGVGGASVTDILDEAHDSAKTGITVIIAPNDPDEYPIAVVLKTSTGYAYAQGQDSKSDYADLIAEAKYRLDVSGIGDGEDDAFHFRSMQSLGIVCTIVGDAGNSPYSVRPGESLNNAAVTSASGAIYASQNDP